MSEDEPFLSRWSRLKRRPEAESKAERAAPPAERDKDRPASAPEKREAATIAEPDKPALDLSTLPNIEELTADSDFTVFLDARVPSGVRQAALRRAWVLDPRIRDFIEVADWQYNWNVPGGAPGYGPLPQGTNVAELLAQVVGAVPRKAATTSADTPTEYDKLSQIEGEAAPRDEPAEPGGGAERSDADFPTDQGIARERRAVEASAEASCDHAVAEDPDPALDEASQGRRRRHGGALPA